MVDFLKLLSFLVHRLWSSTLSGHRFAGVLNKLGFRIIPFTCLRAFNRFSFLFPIQKLYRLLHLQVCFLNLLECRLTLLLAQNFLANLYLYLNNSFLKHLSTYMNNEVKVLQHVLIFHQNLML